MLKLSGTLVLLLVACACSRDRLRAGQTDMLTADDFSWDEFFWTTKATLACWAGFQSRGGPYGAQDSAAPSAGEVTIVFAPEGRDASPLRDEELSLINWAISEQSALRDSALEGLLTRYGAMRAEALEWLEQPDDMPPVESVDRFRDLIGLHSVNVHQISKGGVPYVGLEFGCMWDPEHGLGILMHGTRVVEVGGADTAILLWIARQDAERSK